MVSEQELSYQEKVEIYNTCTKRELIDMLIEANKHLMKITGEITPNDIDWAESIIKEREGE